MPGGATLTGPTDCTLTVGRVSVAPPGVVTDYELSPVLPRRHRQRPRHALYSFCFRVRA
ncbi:hypothetical protein CKO_03581 [Citrobacter koseri ATCC BAA-895]|uniref:Uncharacterized protein n=1 Tax=Citrobacter koseri (strain ATCC BAA-895 / CDC 4225-83 / SGSC4696) TaxID=290338 RepID=A8AME7_CITK8|nr:hypothetical protein CKO_03581 [Citrobacter koseri ATCC BAA-895]